MSEPIQTSGEKDVPIPPPRLFLMSSAVGGLIGAAAGAMLAIWLIGCDCCGEDSGVDARTGQVQTIDAAPANDLEIRLS